jgi:hypothetical protein
MAVLDYFCGLKPTNRPVVINPPKTQPRATRTSDALHKLGKILSFYAKIRPIVEQKYPKIRAFYGEHQQEITRGTEMFFELFNSGVDDRYKRSLPEWAMIVKYANDHSARKAAKKYSGMTPDGEEVRLSIRSIREKMKDPKLQEFFDTYNYYETIFVMFVSIVMKAVGRNPELLAIYEQYMGDYYDDDSGKSKEEKGEGQEGSERSKVYVDTSEQNHCEELLQGNDGDDDDSSESFYDYFFVRHYDPERRKKQKLEYERGLRSSKTCDGKIEHRIDEKDIQPETAQALRLHSLSKTIRAIAMSLAPSRLAKNNEIILKHEKFWLYKCLLNGMNTLDEDGKRIILGDLLNLLIDMGWPKRLVLEKLLADKFELDLSRQYKEAEDKGLKPDYSKFDNVLDETLYEKFRSDWLRQTKIRLNLN